MESNAPPIQLAVSWFILDSHMKLPLDSMLLFIVAVKAVGIEYYEQYFNNIDLISFSLLLSCSTPRRSFIKNKNNSEHSQPRLLLFFTLCILY